MQFIYLDFFLFLFVLLFGVWRIPCWKAAIHPFALFDVAFASAPPSPRRSEGNSNTTTDTCTKMNVSWLVGTTDDVATIF